MSTNILMPALSPTMEEGTLAKWLKSEGDEIDHTHATIRGRIRGQKSRRKEPDPGVKAGEDVEEPGNGVTV